MGLQVLELKEQCKPTMVSSADDLIAWRDFPKGLRVLLLDEDGSSASETRLKLEAMDYIVSTFYNEKDALEVISNKGEIFHVAIVEVTSGNSHVGFKFLETAKDLPTVVISNIRSLSTMMKCIALGAAEFLQKPLSEDKLSNIWQHVVHKAFNAGGNVLTKSLKPVKQTVVSMLNLQSGTAEFKIEVPCESENEKKNQKNHHDDTITTERFSAPSTPQQGVRLAGVGDYEEHVKFSMEQENTENTKDSVDPRKCDCSESKSVDNTCNDFTVVVNKQPVLPYTVEGAAGEEEVDSADWSKTDESSVAKEDSLAPSGMQIGDHLQSRAAEPTKKSLNLPINARSHGKRRNRKEMKVDWTQELHKKFVRAVEQLGIDQAIPSKILDLMKVDGLTRHNVASHLQKFRMHKRHILPKDDDMRWRLHRDPMPTGYMRKPLVAFPPFPSNYGLPPNLPPNQVYPVWGHPSYLPSGAQMWGHVGFPPCHPPPEGWVWNSYSPMHADVWGYPVVPPYSQYMNSLQAPPVSNAWDANQDIDGMSRNYYTVDMATEGVIDEMVKEAMSKPWLPLPLGLKPPSTDFVIAELHRQGIPTIPPPPSASLSAD